MVQSKKTDSQIKQERTSSIMNTVAKRTAYYRSNPSRFAEEVLNINLHWFQKILLFCMFFNNQFIYIASRGQGL